MWVSSAPVRTYQNDRLKTCACILVTATWNNYYLSQTMVTPAAPYHFMFDKNAAGNTGVITWNKNTGTVAVTAGAADVYIVGISLYS